MAKYKLPNPDNTTLDPFAFEKQMGIIRNNDPYVKVGQGLEFNLNTPIGEGYSSLGNSNYAKKAIEQFNVEQQGSLELVAKGVGRTLAKAGTEVLKVPGYLGGFAGAVGNEVFGDGKNSMSIMVDNAWVNAFESMDESLKSLMPVHISEQVKEGNLLDKISSGAWWATQGADGLGFMLSMIAPGALAKLVKTGRASAAFAEVLANNKVGKMLKAHKVLGLTPEVEGIAKNFRAGEAWIRNADGVTAAAINTVIESSAEAAGTFDNTMKQLQEKIRAGEITEEYARQLSGEKAASVFKSNLALLMASNVLEQAWVWKAFGSNESSVLSKAFKDGKLDLTELKKLGSKTFKQSFGDYAKNLGKNALKEGLFEEGIQTQIEQRVNKGNNDGFLGGLTAGSELINNIFTGSDDFWKNTELHEAMFLGSVLGGGMGIVSQIKENNNLKRFLNGYNKANESNTWYNKLLRKTGLKQSPNDSKGILNVIEENYIKNFKQDLSNLQTNGRLDNIKVFNAWKQGLQEQYIHAQYDSAVATGDKIGQEKWGQILAQHYTQPFLGQAGMEKVFEEHVKNDLSEVWKQRFQQSYNREATEQEVQDFQRRFIQSGQQVFNSYNEATRTNYPERYIKQDSNDATKYAKFRQSYFNGKLQLLLDFQALDNVETETNERFRKTGLESKIERLDNFGYKLTGSVTAKEARDIQQHFKLLKDVDSKRKEFSEQYELFFDKKSVQALYDAITSEEDENIEEVIKSENEELKKEAEEIQQTTANKEQQIKEALAENPETPVSINGTPTTVVETPDGFEANGRTLTPEEIYNSRIDTSAEADQTIESLQEEVSNPVLEEVVDNDEVSEILDNDEVSDKPVNGEKYIVSELGRLAMTDKRTAGRHIQYTTKEFKYSDKRDDEGFPLLGTENQQVFFNYIDTLNSKNHTVIVAPLSYWKSREDVYTQILEDAEGITLKDNDLYIVVLKDGKEVKVEDKFVIQSLMRPETMYDITNTRIAERAIDEYPGNNFMEKLTNAKNSYIAWYNSFKEATELEIDNVSEGHTLTKVKDGEVQWQSATEHLPSNSILDVSITGEIIWKGRIIEVPKGDVVAITRDGVLPLKVNNLEQQDVAAIINLLQLITPNTDIKSIKVNVEGKGEVGAFYDEVEVPLIKYFTRMEKKEGSFWVNSDKRSISYHPYGKEVSVVAIDNIANDDNFKRFLLDKRFNVNKNLFGKASIVFNKGKFEATLLRYEQEVMMRSKTYNVIDERFPSRLQRYLVLGSSTGRTLVENKSENLETKSSSLASRRDRARQAKDKLADKVFSVDEILEIKIQSGEIKKICK